MNDGTDANAIWSKNCFLRRKSFFGGNEREAEDAEESSSF